MASSYPGALDTLANPAPTDAMNDGDGHAAQHADANDAIEAIQATLGIDPQGGEATVADRLDAMGGGGGGGGLVLIDSGTFSAVSAVNVDNVFDGTYDDYRIILRVTGSTNILMGFRLRVSSTDATTNYSDVRAAHWSTTGNVTSNTVTNAWNPVLCGSGQPCLSEMDLCSPAIAEETMITGTMAAYYNTTGRLQCTVAGIHTTTTAYDGFTLFPDTGTISGRWAVYGYAK